ncbi:hypothetical protein BH11PSE9_BH11PSE9_30210 [soil metagenome]
MSKPLHDGSTAAYHGPVSNYFATGRLAPFAAASAGAGEVVGTHDGAQATLHLGALDDEVVFHHEFGHEILFTRTTHGALLAVLWQAIDRRGPLTAGQFSRLETTAQTLTMRCRTAHEVFATYYGLKMVEPAIAVAALRTLPREYRRYFRTAAKVLDPHFASTFLQVRVALSVGAAAFESCFTMRFLRRPWLAWKATRRDEQPDRRLESLLGYLADGGAAELRRMLDAWAAEFFAATGTPAWDLDDEAGWQALAVEAHRLDVFLDRRIVEWIGNLGVVPLLSREERSACLAGLRSFAAECGIPVKLIDTEEPVEEVPPTGLPALLEYMRKDPHARVHALKQAASYVANQPLAATFERVTREELWSRPQYQQADSIAVVAPDPGRQGAPWTIVGFCPPGVRGNVVLNGRPAHAAHASGGEVIAWLNEIERGGSRAWRGPLPEPIVVPFGNDAHLGPLPFSLDGQDEPGKFVYTLGRQMAMYVVGSWIAFVEKAASHAPVVLTELQVDIGGYEGSEAQPLTLKIALCAYLPGRCFLRAFARNSGTAVDVLALDWRSNPAIQLLSAEEAEQRGLDLGFVAGAMNGILAFWSRF